MQRTILILNEINERALRLAKSLPIAMNKETGAEKQFDQQQIQKGKMGLQQAGTLQGQTGTESGTLLPAYQSILANPGYSASDKSAITLNTLGGLGASFGGASDAAQNRMARTRNTAGFGDTLDELARERGRQTSTAEAGLQEKFADTALSERDKALSGLSNLYGIDSRTLTDLLQPQRPTPYRPGFLDTLGSSYASMLGKGIVGNISGISS